MPAIFPLIAKFLALVVSGLVFRALASIGFAYVTYTGLGSIMDNIKSYITGLFSAVPSDVVMILGLAKVDVAFNIMLAAVMARLALAGMDKVSGSLTALVLGSKAMNG